MDSMVLYLVVLGAFLALVIGQVVRLEIVGLATIVALALTRLLTPAEAFGGFSSAATVTVAAMLVLSAGVERSGAMDWAAARLAGSGRRGERAVLLGLMAPVALLSAFMNNTPVVALMIPATLAVGRRTGLPPSRLLMPVSFASILGGTCTLIGTSTNILVDSLYRSHGGPGFGIFEFWTLGIACVLVGGGYLLVCAPRLLPRRLGLAGMLPAAGSGAFVTVVTLPEDSPFAGRTLGEVFADERGARVVELVRGEDPHLKPDAGMVLEAGDLVLLEGSANAIHALLERKGLAAGTALADDRRVRISRVDLHLVEAVVVPNSSFRDRRVRDLGLSRRFGVQVLGLRRLGRQHHRRLRDLRLHAGDVLLVQGEPQALKALEDDHDVLLMHGVEETVKKPAKAPMALGILLAVVASAAAGLAPLPVAGLAGAALMLLTGCLDTRAAVRALDPAVLLLIAASLPLGVAMEQVGLASEVAGAVARAGEVFGDGYGVFLLVGLVYLATSLTTEVMSNNAAAVLLVPIALQVAEQTGMRPEPLLVAIAFGASASFATPVGYQTNTLVMGPGEYRFRDYLRLGAPLNLITWLIATALIPLLWPA